jgi:hypothetical protein
MDPILEQFTLIHNQYMDVLSLHGTSHCDRHTTLETVTTMLDVTLVYNLLQYFDIIHFHETDMSYVCEFRLPP